jgi:hypothetical protein
MPPHSVVDLLAQFGATSFPVQGTRSGEDARSGALAVRGVSSVSPACWVSSSRIWFSVSTGRRRVLTDTSTPASSPRDLVDETERTISSCSPSRLLMSLRSLAEPSPPSTARCVARSRRTASPPVGP